MKLLLVPSEPLPTSLVLDLVKHREKCRETKNWQKADEIRKKLKALGYWAEDTEQGPKIKKI